MLSPCQLGEQVCPVAAVVSSLTQRRPSSDMVHVSPPVHFVQLNVLTRESGKLVFVILVTVAGRV